MSQMTEPMGPVGPGGSTSGLMGGPMGPMDAPMGPMGDPMGPMGDPMGPMDGPMGPMGGPMGSPAGIRTAEPAGRQEPIALKSMARVDLLPPEITENRRFARVRRGVIALVALSLLLAVAGGFLSRYGVTEAQQQLEAATASKRSAFNAQSKYAELPKLDAQLTAAKSARLTAMSQDILFYRLLNDLKTSSPAGVNLTSANVALATAPGAAAASTTAEGGAGAVSPLTPTGIGSIQLTGTATSYSLLATWLNSAGQVTGLAGVSLTSASEDPSTAGIAGRVSFNATAVLTADALSNRYTKES